MTRHGNGVLRRPSNRGLPLDRRTLLPRSVPLVPMSALAESRASADHRLGVFFVAASAAAWSVSGIFARLLQVDVWTTVSLRAGIGAVYMLIGLIYVHRGESLAAIRSI